MPIRNLSLVEAKASTGAPDSYGNITQFITVAGNPETFMTKSKWVADQIGKGFMDFEVTKRVSAKGNTYYNLTKPQPTQASGHYVPGVQEPKKETDWDAKDESIRRQACMKAAAEIIAHQKETTNPATSFEEHFTFLADSMLAWVEKRTPTSESDRKLMGVIQEGFDIDTTQEVPNEVLEQQAELSEVRSTTDEINLDDIPFN